MGAMATAEKIRFTCASAPMPAARGPIRVTASFGVAVVQSEVDTTTDTVAALLGRADAALYRSKNAGRNRVTSAADVGLWSSEWTRPT
jgi:two-component system cell cycle response regulator